MVIKSIYTRKKAIEPSNDCWIHLQDLRFFLFLGANPYEKKIGQNIKIDLSLKIKFNETEDKLENTVDYGQVVEYIKEYLSKVKEINLLEYLCEQLLDQIGAEFKGIKAAKIIIEKGYVPLQNYTGIVKIEAEKTYL